MKHISKSEIKEMHYIPANNVFAFYLMGGKDGAEAEIIELSERMDKEAAKLGTCSTCRMAFQQWYLRSCHLVLKGMVAGEKPNQDYPPFVSPCWAEGIP